MLNLDQRTKTKAAWVATLLAPLLAVQSVRYLVIGDAHPFAAGAAMQTTTMTPVAMPDAPKPPTSAQAKAAQWLNGRTVALNLHSPMDRPDPVATPAPTPIAEPVAPIAPAPAPRLDDTPRHLVLTGILGGAGESARSLASINHRIYRVGEEVVTGWRVTSIDSKRRSVTLSHQDGRTLEMEPAAP